MKTFFESFRKKSMNIISFKKKKMIKLTIKLKEPCEKTKTCYVCKGKFNQKYTNNSNYRKVQRPL